MNTDPPSTRRVRAVDTVHRVQSLLNRLAGELVAQDINTDPLVGGPIGFDGLFDPVGGVGVSLKARQLRMR